MSATQTFLLELHCEEIPARFLKPLCNEFVDALKLRLADWKIVKDFNVVAAEDGYKAEILSPLQHSNLESKIWVGRTKNAESFGKGWDAYRSAQADANSSRGKLGARFAACSTLVARRSYETN